MITIAVVNQKGGVGKTTLAFNLGRILSSKRGAKVLAIDNDPQGNLTSSFLEDPTEMKGTILNIYEDGPIELETINRSLSFLGAGISLAQVAEHDFQIRMN